MLLHLRIQNLATIEREYASGKTNMRNEGERCQAQASASTDHDPLVKGLSMSVSARTRKMVNYACVG